MIVTGDGAVAVVVKDGCGGRGRSGRDVHKICCTSVEEMICINGPLRGKTMVNSMYHTTLKYNVP